MQSLPSLRLLLLLLAIGLAPILAALVPQDVTKPFWEPLPFATLPEQLITQTVFYQDKTSTQGKVYTISGSNDPNGATIVVTDVVYEMTVATERWKRVTTTGDTLTGRFYHFAALVTHPSTNKSSIITYGGYKPILNGLSAVPIQDYASLDMDTFAWTNKGKTVSLSVGGVFPYTDMTCCSTCAVAACPDARGAPAGVVFANAPSIAYMFGGQTLAGLLQDLWKYDVVTDAWTKMTITNTIPTSRIGSAVVGLSQGQPRKRILVFSGTYFVGLTPTLTGSDLYMLEETASNVWNWTLIFPANSGTPSGRANSVFTLVGSLFLVWGGETPSNKATGGPMYAMNTSASDYRTWAWTTIPIASGEYEPPDTAGAGLVFIPSQGALTFIGGINATGASVRPLYKFHALGLLPPVPRNIGSDVPVGYDFNNDTDTVCIFNNTSPNFVINSRAAVPDPTIFGSFLGRLVEATSGGVEVSELLLPASDFVVGYELRDDVTGGKITVFTRHGVDNSASTQVNQAVTVRLEFYQFSTDTVVDNAPLPSFPVKAGDIKFTIRLSGWPFASNQNKLRFEMQLAINSPGSTANSTSTAAPYGLDYIFSAGGKQVLFNTMGQSLNDNATIADVITTISLATSPPPTIDISFEFASFVDTLFFDPSFGALVDTSSSGDGGGSGGGGGGGGDGDSNTAIFVGVFVSFGVVAIVMVAVIVGALITWWLIHNRQVRARARLGSVMEASASDAAIPL